MVADLFAIQVAAPSCIANTVLHPASESKADGYLRPTPPLEVSTSFIVNDTRSVVFGLNGIITNASFLSRIQDSTSVHAPPPLGLELVPELATLDPAIRTQDRTSV